LEQIFASGEMQAEIISADSMQVYRGMDIGTAKPSLKEREKIPHHLIDLRDPKEQFNAGEFVHLAEEGCLDIAGRGKLPVVSGGTGFYLKNLILGLPEAPPSDMEIRLLLKQELLERGAATLMEELSKADPVSASRIHVNDEYRLLRALEVLRLTGRPLSSFTSPCVKIRKENHRDHGVSRRNDKKSNQNSVFLRVLRGNTLCFFLIGLKRSREELYRRINERTAAMFRAGLPTEVKRLYDAGYTPEDPGLRAIGYREFFVIDNGAWRLSEDLAGVEALVAQNSRRYAKRQITFFASLPNIKWVDCGENIASEIESLLQNQWLKPGK
jgi:tRNA dimethylallyltransferase